MSKDNITNSEIKKVLKTAGIFDIIIENEYIESKIPIEDEIEDNFTYILKANRGDDKKIVESYTELPMDHHLIMAAERKEHPRPFGILMEDGIDCGDDIIINTGPLLETMMKLDVLYREQRWDEFVQLTEDCLPLLDSSQSGIMMETIIPDAKLMVVDIIEQINGRPIKGIYNQEYSGETYTEEMSLLDEPLEYLVESPVSNETIKHISTGTWEDGILRSGCHSEKGFNTVKNKGWFDPNGDVTTYSNGARKVIMSKHPNSRRRTQIHTFFPKEWNENNIRQAVTKLQKDETLPKLQKSISYYQKIGIIEEVRIIIGIQIKNDDNILVQAYPDSDQNNI